MPTSKLTLSADERLVRRAEVLAEKYDRDR